MGLTNSHSVESLKESSLRCEATAGRIASVASRRSEEDSGAKQPAQMSAAIAVILSHRKAGKHPAVTFARHGQASGKQVGTHLVVGRQIPYASRLTVSTERSGGFLRTEQPIRFE